MIYGYNMCCIQLAKSEFVSFAKLTNVNLPEIFLENPFFF